MDVAVGWGTAVTPGGTAVAVAVAVGNTRSGVVGVNSGTGVAVGVGVSSSDVPQARLRTNPVANNTPAILLSFILNTPIGNLGYISISHLDIEVNVSHAPPLLVAGYGD